MIMMTAQCFIPVTTYLEVFVHHIETRDEGWSINYLLENYIELDFL